MEYRKLGRTGLSVSEICLGTMTFGQQNSEAEGHAQLDMAFDHGVNFIDTAELYSIPPKAETYGATETIVGNWLAQHGQRDKVVLASKVVGRSVNDWYRPDGKGARLTPEQIRYAVEGSLRRLKTDYLDLYQVHWPDRKMNLFGAGGTTFRDVIKADEVPIEETLGGLDELVKEGKIRHVGVSNETPWGVSQYLNASREKGLTRIASIQNAYNLLNRTYEMGLAEMGLREDVGLLAYSPLAQGYLTGKYLDGARPAGARTTLFNRGQRYEKPGVDQAIRGYMQIARDAGIDPAQFALEFVTSRPFVASNIIGATSLEQLKTILDSVHVEITPELEEKIDAVHQVNANPAP
ncbi:MULTISPECIES: NADP(H)-dependent aldo-keto reductase [unclassified Saccharibacter]|uniref:NADP(H)-dependent aldo-keto reductase n=1 Tax=unclassified Saccharibacter TaxID=2648722 RepID=UPI0013295336|nr:MULTISPECIES: NADP(H)-dependent aldo-keto reductase [unclassified Saccharibacter]MXV37040.1 NADP(H)-dependent aldo-keto reductase [Saccharibacter sp. EH611]MXV58470.1 NADP(H)-dependent aldo-keto reductase [Saccharibacter sp. EH70]MXV65976.1 NADP(H)-dependent aldo-keto reductase [Saccharibacter sp. EH60]